jgi:SAM-dependent methyltransferase
MDGTDMAKTGPFDAHSALYERWFAKNRYAYQSELNAVKALMPETGMGMEIGVGSGHFASPLGIKFGLEPSEIMREMAQRRGIEVIAGVAESLPYEASRFDFVLMVTTICFLDDVDASMREAHRVLIPTGSFIIGFVDKNSFLGRHYLEHKDESVFYKDANFYSVDEVTHYLRKSNFHDFVYTQTIFHPLSEIKAVEPVRRGYGEGAFIVVKAVK